MPARGGGSIRPEAALPGRLLGGLPGVGPTSPGKLGVTRSGGLEAATIATLLAPGAVIALGQAFQMRKYRRLRAQLLAAEISTEQT